jgi:hypothetical protein
LRWNVKLLKQNEIESPNSNQTIGGLLIDKTYVGISIVFLAVCCEGIVQQLVAPPALAPVDFALAFVWFVPMVGDASFLPDFSNRPRFLGLG